jgi:hypothetical protein
MTRIRFAMSLDATIVEPFKGTVEVDEVYIGGKPRYKGSKSIRGRGAQGKTMVFAAVERGGDLRRRIMPDVNVTNLKNAIRMEVDRSARVISDEFNSYKGIGKEFAGGHHTVCHKYGEYARGDVHTNTVESSHALLKRSMIGIYHNVSHEYLHRYLWHSNFLWDNRKMNDGERTIAAIKSAEGKRMTYKQVTAN